VEGLVKHMLNAPRDARKIRLELAALRAQEAQSRAAANSAVD